MSGCLFCAKKYKRVQSASWLMYPFCLLGQKNRLLSLTESNVLFSQRKKIQDIEHKNLL